MRYALHGSDRIIALGPAVLEHFDRHRQTRFWHCEAGGLLFVGLDGDPLIVRAATGPRPTDKRWRYGYWPDRRAEQAEIDEHHRRGLHFIGTWHTHPEDRPTASRIDVRSIADIFRQSSHGLNGFLMVVVGRLSGASGLFVGCWDGSELHVLAEVAAPVVPGEEPPGTV